MFQAKGSVSPCPSQSTRRCAPHMLHTLTPRAFTATAAPRLGRDRPVASASRDASLVIRSSRSTPRGLVKRNATASTTPVALPQLLPLDGSYEAATTFAPFANWLIPGRVMLGRYPYCEPSRCSDRSMGDAQLKQILEAGVTTFVQLQAEIPSQQELTAAGKDGFLAYKPTAELIQASLEGPAPQKIVQGLRNPYLDKFLPDARKPGAPDYKPKELIFATFPIVDLSIPSDEELKTFLMSLKARLDKGQVLYVHCWGGRGRAGTIGACLLSYIYGIKADEALERVQRAYTTRKDPERSKSPETDQQFEFVRNLIATF